MTKQIINNTEIKNLATLAALSPSPTLYSALQSGVEGTLEYAQILSTVNTESTKELKDITGLTNVLREDTVDESRMFSQTEALANAPATQDGYVMVGAVFAEE